MQNYIAFLTWGFTVYCLLQSSSDQLVERHKGRKVEAPLCTLMAHVTALFFFFSFFLPPPLLLWCGQMCKPDRTTNRTTCAPHQASSGPSALFGPQLSLALSSAGSAEGPAMQSVWSSIGLSRFWICSAPTPYGDTQHPLPPFTAVTV